MEPLVGIEPTTYSLRMNCSTPELQRRLNGRAKRNQKVAKLASGKWTTCGNAAKVTDFSPENISRLQHRVQGCRAWSLQRQVSSLFDEVFR